MVSTRRSFVDEREDIQKKAFTKWINNQLANVRQEFLFFFIFFDMNTFIFSPMHLKKFQIYFKIYVMALYYFDYWKYSLEMNMYVQ